MEDVSTSKKPKGTNTKKDKEDMMSKTPFFLKMRRITDTNGSIIKGYTKDSCTSQPKRQHFHFNHDERQQSNVGVALDFEYIREEDVNESDFGSRLDELGKVAIKKKHLGTLSSLSAFIGFAREYEKDHEKILQAASNVVK